MFLMFNFFITGAVIGLEVNGDDSIKLSNDTLHNLLQGKKKSEVAYVSMNKETSLKDIDNFYNFVDMTMS